MPKHSSQRSGRHQRGMATLLLVILVGLAMTATAFGVAHAVRGTQESQLSLHAVTPAQDGAWDGAEAVRRYLQKADENTLATLSGALKIDGSTLAANVVSVVKGKDSKGRNTYRITVDLVGSAADGTTAASKSVLQAVYDVTPQPGSGNSNSGLPNQPTLINTINIYKDLNLTGGIKVLGGNNANLNVQGNVTLDNATVDGINTIRATGNVTVGSGIHVNSIYSNGDVTVTGAASADLINALGNVTINGGAKPFAIQSNGTVTFNGGSASSVDAIGDVIVPAGGIVISSIRTMGKVYWTGSGGSAGSITANGSVTYAGGNNGTTIRAIGDVRLPGGGAQTIITQGNTTLDNSGAVGQLTGQGDLTVNTWTGVSGTIGGTLTKSSPYMGANITVQPGLKVDITPVALAKLPPVTVDKPAIDAYALKDAANYVFDFVNGAIQVTVSNVNGIDSGTYFLGYYPQANGRGYQDFLCAKLVPGTLNSSGKGQCSKPATPYRTICQAFSNQNDCLGYNNGTWSLNGKSFARGVLWFHGDLNPSTGYYLDTLIATGNISTSGAHRTDAPNYAGYDQICTNATPAGLASSGSGLTDQQVADFAGVYPSNFCDIANKQLIANPIGNVALLAGGYVGDTFSGGNITVGASSVINGSVLAGNTISTGGSTNINGYITAAAQNKSDTTPVSLSGATLLDYSKLPDTYQPGSVPCMKNCNNATQATNDNLSTITWTRYL
ncbi:hypothetical protein KK141_22320 [Dyella sp. LX-66]|uniref:FapA family protein n=1 Tax=unclassified Dyella TaxID=2634549 RepID=UPI001BE0A4C3|nr:MULTISPECIES: FapA family protein [unclassified Dyella]MBT2119821.1 hypothetical protein [Dyella sp. LX-1]MBT2142298.1 hypothetical protein [Dyella sp. LX-66]